MMASILDWFGARGTLPQWGSFAALWSIVAGILGVWIKGMPERRRAENEGRKIDNEANAEHRREDRDDVARLTQRMDIQDQKLEEAARQAQALEQRAVTLELQIGQLNFALRLAVQEIEAGLPHSRIPNQIKELLAAAFPAKVPSAVEQADMDILRKI